MIVCSDPFFTGNARKRYISIYVDSKRSYIIVRRDGREIINEIYIIIYNSDSRVV